MNQSVYYTYRNQKKCDDKDNDCNKCIPIPCPIIPPGPTGPTHATKSESC